MKKTYRLLSIIFLFLTGNTFFNSSQIKAQDFEAGLLLGLNASQIDGDGFGGYDKTGFKIGGFVKRRFTDEWAFQFELLFNQRGSQAKTSEGENPIYLYELNYIDIPVMAQYYFFDELYAEAGLEFGYLLSADEERDFIPLDAADRTESIAINYAIGAAYNFYENFSVHLRLSNSLTSVRDSSLNVENSNKGQLSRVISFGISYLFNK